MIVTESILLRGMSVNGSWSLAQLAALGVNTKRNKGWKQRLIGTDVPEADVERFLSLRDNHLKRRTKYNDLDTFFERFRAWMDRNSHVMMDEEYPMVYVDEIEAYMRAYESD